MSYNGSGTFNINTSGQPVVTGTVISSTAFNALTADLGTGLSTAITKNGQTTVTANIPFNGFKLTGIGVATASGDALTYGQAATVTTLVASTSITDSGLTSGRVTYAGTGGLLQDSANLTFNGTTLTANTIGAFTLSGTVAGGGNNINNVIIGATTPLAGAFTTLSATGVITGTASGGATGSINVTPTTGTSSAYANFVNTGGAVSVGQDSSTGGAITGVAYAAALWHSGNYPVIIGSNNAKVGSFSSTGLAVTGTAIASTSVGVGNTTPSGGGAGIAFPATQSASTDANTLDDYEEGTWTPNVSGNATYSLQSGTYVKVGRLVTVRCQMQINVIGTGSSTTISGLPFTAATSETPISVGYFYTLATSVGFIGGYVNNLASSVSFVSTTSNQTNCTNNPNILGSSARIDFSASYYS